MSELQSQDASLALAMTLLMTSTSSHPANECSGLRRVVSFRPGYVRGNVGLRLPADYRNALNEPLPLRGSCCHAFDSSRRLFCFARRGTRNNVLSKRWRRARVKHCPLAISFGL